MKMDENSKVTLTIGQLKRLVQEARKLASKDFEIKDGVLVKYHGEGGDVVIPKKVTSIGGFAFYECSELTSVMIPDGVTSIGDSAFERCSSLTSVTIPDGVTSIGTSAFQRCSNLTSITIPGSVTKFGLFVFDGCSEMTKVNILNPELFERVIKNSDVYFSGTPWAKEVKSRKSSHSGNNTNYSACHDYLRTGPTGHWSPYIRYESAKVTLTIGQLKRLVKESQDSQMTEDVAKYIADIVQKGLDKAYPGVKLIAYGDDYPHGIDMSNMNISNGKLDKEDERWLGINVKFPEVEDFPGSWTPNGLDIAVKVGSRPDDCDLMFGGWEPNDPKDTKGYYQDTVHRLQAAGYDIDDLVNNLKSIAGKAMDDAAEYVEDCYGEDDEYDDYDPDANSWPRRPAELAGVPSTPYPQRITLWEKEKSAVDKNRKAITKGKKR